MKWIKKIIKLFLPYINQYDRFNKAKLQSDYWEYLRFRLGIEKRYWPAKRNCVIANSAKIYVGINALVGRPGAYIQGAGKVYIGNYVQLAPNVGILSSNHDLYDQRKSNNEKVEIGDYCWIGMNSVVLPGVILGTRTIVAAGSVVTKSFEEGFCIIAGSPAKVIRRLDPNKFIPWRDEVEYYGFVPKEKFERTELYKNNFKV